MSAAARAVFAVAAITAGAVGFGFLLDALIRVAPFHGTHAVTAQLAIAAVVPIWAYGVRAVVLHSIRAARSERALH